MNEGHVGVAGQDPALNGDVVRQCDLGEREDRPDHALHLDLVRAAVAADGLLHRRRRILGAGELSGRARDEHGAARLSDGERDAGVGADVRLLQRHRIRRVLGHERCDSVEDRLEAQIQALAGASGPAPVHSDPEAPFAFVDYAVSASSRSGVDAEDFHADTLSTLPDDSCLGPFRPCQFRTRGV